MPLRAPCFTASSPIHGTGLYSAGVLHVGRVVWQLDRPDFYVHLGDAGWPWMEPRFIKWLTTYGCMERAQDGRLMWMMCCDDARFMNHSDDPNTEKFGHDMLIARRNIAVGEEITCNYGDWCLLGAPT